MTTGDFKDRYKATEPVLRKARSRSHLRRQAFSPVLYGFVVMGGSYVLFGLLSNATVGHERIWSLYQLKISATDGRL